MTFAMILRAAALGVLRALAKRVGIYVVLDGLGARRRTIDIGSLVRQLDLLFRLMRPR
jgi:hypothetical protein